MQFLNCGRGLQWRGYGSCQLQKLNHLNVNYDIIDEGDKFAQESHKMQNANVKSESMFTKT